ncbi:MAG: HutD family protein, partial [Gemmatimonadaceae bacterium]
MRILKADKYLRMPWRNGHGETAQVAISPAAATLDDFDWRVSMARIDDDGAFSIFPQTDRTLAVLRGEGLHLSVDGATPVVLTRSSEPRAFPGDVAAYATLIGGAVTDLNVMTRRGRFTHSMQALRIANRLELNVNATLALLVCVNSDVQVQVSTQTFSLNPLDSLLVDETPSEISILSNATALAYLIEIGPETGVRS